ncbi:MAG: tetratricopeptide repeat protein [Dysgonamonadaceae bacterium]|jgi:tetratricopeptide (TPR) repeat protein|nr:tetratricopeptide repeat protein [Dysgonamonadaceae bacterium]
MSKKSNSSAERDMSNVGEILSRSEQFIDKYKKQIIVGVSAIVLIVVIVLAVKHLYLVPKESAAEAEIFRGEIYFANSQWDLALYGDSIEFDGFIAIINNYSFTRTANLANAYAGICYYHKGELENAMKHLKKFSSKDKMVSPVITGLVGDCYVDAGKVKEGIGFFMKAASRANDNLISPIFLKKAGIAHESLGEFQKAKDAYTTIQEKYPTSQEAADIQKYIERAIALSK